nr:unnamed protein product [Callosobruchus chinensis]
MYSLINNSGERFTVEEEIYNYIPLSITRNGTTKSQHLQTCIKINKQFECSGIKVRTKDYPLVIVSLYRSPEGDFNVFLEKFDALLNLLSLKCKHYKIVICGDFNINFNKNTLALSSLMDILNSYLLKPIIKQPTRSSSCIDNICINVDTLNYNAAVVNNNISDHFAQVLTLYCQKSEQPPKISYQYRDLYNKTNNKHFLTMLSQETWEHIYQASGNVNERFDTFLQTFQYYIDVAFPLKTKIIGRHKVRKPWITKGILVSNDRLHYLYKLSKAGDIFLKDYYRSYKRVYARVLRAAKRLYYNKLIINAKNQTRSAWKIHDMDTIGTALVHVLLHLVVHVWGTQVGTCGQHFRYILFPETEDL